METMTERRVDFARPEGARNANQAISATKERANASAEADKRIHLTDFA